MKDRSGAPAPHEKQHTGTSNKATPAERPLSQRIADLETRVAIQLDPYRGGKR